jgi:hypothetical protein
MSKKYIPKRIQDSYPEIDKKEAIQLLVKSKEPMVLKYINGESIVFVADIHVSGSGPNECRIRAVATIPWEKRDLFISSPNYETTYVFPSKLDPDWITVNYSRFDGK